jgi:GTPase SAR1 family protein
MFYKRVKLAILVYSIDNRKSFEGISFWLNEIRLNSDENVKLILVGNKNDLNDKREVSFEEGQEFAKSNGFNYFCETSAKEGDTPSAVLSKAAEILYDYEIESKKKNNKNDKTINDSEDTSFRLEEYSEKQNNKLGTTSCNDCI